MYTSGSTGEPKAVMIEHGGLANMVDHQIRVFEVDTGCRVLQVAPASFDASISEIMMALLAGAVLEVASADELVPGPALLDTLRRREVTHVTLVPSVLSALSAESLPSLRVLISAGEACTADIVTRWARNRKLFNAYGPTETTVCTSIARLTDPADAAIVGEPVANLSVFIVDPWGNPAALGMAGEIYVAGPGVARGYQHDPELSARKFVELRAGNAEVLRAYRTGDLGRRRFDDRLEFIGRADEQVKVAGCRVELAEVQRELLRVPGVDGAAVVVRVVGGNQNQLVAYAAGEGLRAEDIRAELQRKLPAYMVPAHVVALRAIPLLPSGKLNRAALPAPGSARPAGDDLSALDPIELRVARIWEEVLETPVSPGDNFYQLGGNSLAALRLASRVSATFAGDVSLNELLRTPTIEAQAHLIRRGASTGASRRRLVKIRSGRGNPLYCLAPAGGSTLSYYALAEHLPAEQAVYGVDVQRDPNDGMRELVGKCAELLLAQRRAGPLQIFGWSTGATLAHALTAELSQAGVEVGLVGLVEPSFWFFRDCEHASDQALLVRSFLKQLSLRGDAEALLERWAQAAPAAAGGWPLQELFAEAQRGGLLPPDVDPDWLMRRYQQFESNVLTVRDYEPVVLEAPVVLFVSATSYGRLVGGAAPIGAAGWRHRYPGLLTPENGAASQGLHVVPGDHFSMLQRPNVAGLASMLAARLATNAGSTATKSTQLGRRLGGLSPARVDARRPS
jgi:nonribosomal peptide synthetase DhbF